MSLEAIALSSFPAYLSSSTLLSSPKHFPFIKPSIFFTSPSLSLNFPFSPLPLITPTRNLCSVLCSAVHEAPVEEEAQEASSSEDDEEKAKRKLFVYNLERGLSMEDIRNIFSECGTVENVEVIVKKGYTFVTMASAEEAQAAIDRFHSQEVSGRVLTIQQAKRFERPPRKLPGELPFKRKLYKLYVTNLSWGVKKTHLKEIFSTSFKPISARVMFPHKGTTGFGFVSFATKEEAEAALSATRGKELMGRPLRIEMGLRNKDLDEPTRKTEEEEEDRWEMGSQNQDVDTSPNEEENLSEAHSTQAVMDV